MAFDKERTMTQVMGQVGTRQLRYSDIFQSLAGGDSAVWAREPADSRGWNEPHRTGVPNERGAACQALDLELARIASDEAHLDARRTRCLREVERLESWRHFGYPSILAYLEYRLGCSPRTALDRLRVARALGTLPLLEAALDRGELSPSAVRELCRVADPATEGAWLAHARGKNLRDIEDAVRGRPKGAQPDGPADPDLATRRITIEMTPGTYALYRQTVAQLADESGRRLEEDEAFATICRRALEPASNEAPDRAPFQVAITVCDRCQRGWQDGAGAVIEIEPAAVEVALCDAQHVGSLDADTPARAYQDITPAVRRLVWRRDHGRCRVTGCRSARNLDMHHIDHRADGGGHDPANLALMCSGCHFALHRGLLVVQGAAPNVVFTRAHELETRDPGRLGTLQPCQARPGEVSLVEATSALSASSASSVSGSSSASSASRPGFDASRLTAITLRVQARDVLTASGFSKHEAITAVDAAFAELGSTVSLEELLRVAFRRCRRPTG